MACEPYVSPDGSIVGIICGRSRTVPKCYICGANCTTLCDYPIGNGNTCDKPTCKKHKVNIGYDVDVCKEHANKEDIEKTLKAVSKND